MPLGLTPQNYYIIAIPTILFAAPTSLSNTSNNNNHYQSTNCSLIQIQLSNIFQFKNCQENDITRTKIATASPCARKFRLL